jgi:hypothetical protein
MSVSLIVYVIRGDDRWYPFLRLDRSGRLAYFQGAGLRGPPDKPLTEVTVMKSPSTLDPSLRRALTDNVPRHGKLAGRRSSDRDDAPDTSYWTAYDHFMVEREARAMRRAYVWSLIARGMHWLKTHWLNAASNAAKRVQPRA